MELKVAKMKMEHSAVGWFTCLVFTWIAVALFGALIIGHFAVFGEVGKLVLDTLLSLFSIIAGMTFAISQTSCCYCCL